MHDNQPRTVTPDALPEAITRTFMLVVVPPPPCTSAVGN